MVLSQLESNKSRLSLHLDHLNTNAFVSSLARLFDFVQIAYIMTLLVSDEKLLEVAFHGIKSYENQARKAESRNDLLLPQTCPKIMTVAYKSMFEVCLNVVS